MSRDAGPMGARLRVCLVYDCLYPHTVGGAERWYGVLAAELVRSGHEVTYLTRRQWAANEPPDIPGVRVIDVSRADDLYDESGRRKVGPPLRFGLGVLRHLIHHRNDYDVVHTCAFPYFSILAARLALAGSDTQIGVDWFEVWSDAYWREYLGRTGGAVGSAVQTLCIRATPLAFVASERHRRRLLERNVPGDVLPIGGLYAPGPDPDLAVDPPDGAEGPLVLFVGRLIPEKRADLIPAVLLEVRKQHPTARALIVGDGPSRPVVEEAVRATNTGEWTRMAGFVETAAVTEAMAAASCLVLPSSREGYGLVVIEAAAIGTPVVVVDGPDNAAVELIEPGVNGMISPTDRPSDIAAIVADVITRGPHLRQSTRGWFDANAARLRIDRSGQTVVRAYEDRAASRRG